MIKVFLTFLSIGGILSQRQIQQEKFEFTSPVDFVYRRHYIESLSTSSKLFDLGTPSGSKVSLKDKNFQVTAGSTLNCDFQMIDQITMQPASCNFTAGDSKSDLNNALNTINEYLKAQSGSLYGLLYSFANVKIQVLVHSNNYADTRHFLVSTSFQ